VTVTDYDDIVLWIWNFYTFLYSKMPTACKKDVLIHLLNRYEEFIYLLAVLGG
jgi:hypothetical protein